MIRKSLMVVTLVVLGFGVMSSQAQAQSRGTQKPQFTPAPYKPLPKRTYFPPTTVRKPSPAAQDFAKKYPNFNYSSPAPYQNHGPYTKGR
jgi:hypothetical protein